jgi:tight adherence protein B
MAIKVQTETGGNLAEVLSRLSNLMRARAMLRLKVRSITAEGRLSGILLSITPLVLFGVITLLKPDYYSGVTQDPVFWPSVASAFVLLVVGNITMYKMVNFKV